MTDDTTTKTECTCSCGWALLQVPDDAGDSWPTFTWLDAATGRELFYCPACGTPLGLDTVRPAD